MFQSNFIEITYPDDDDGDDSIDAHWDGEHSVDLHYDSREGEIDELALSLIYSFVVDRNRVHCPIMKPPH